MLKNTTVRQLLLAAERARLDGFEQTAEALIGIAHHMNEHCHCQSATTLSSSLPVSQAELRKTTA